ncbi:hypothetical protein HanHA300_Chr17g0677011 [Helianthus annuus]|nr:hypothetical protein HanHA300_Chr17g0677011 [Helianthus annuus]KAJ0436265.1 hypothetical protein HanIR_Chr17g0902721 [Helianthus annuus]KAJ0449583.1 hypothetical protein HanHA89_Chr17g0730181 [Helianthus annuus]
MIMKTRTFRTKRQSCEHSVKNFDLGVWHGRAMRGTTVRFRQHNQARQCTPVRSGVQAFLGVERSCDLRHSRAKLMTKPNPGRHCLFKRPCTTSRRCTLMQQLARPCEIEDRSTLLMSQKYGAT